MDALRALAEEDIKSLARFRAVSRDYEFAAVSITKTVSGDFEFQQQKLKQEGLLKFFRDTGG